MVVQVDQMHGQLFQKTGQGTGYSVSRHTHRYLDTKSDVAWCWMDSYGIFGAWTGTRDAAKRGAFSCLSPRSAGLPR